MALLTFSWMTDLLALVLGLVTVFYIYFTRNFNYWEKLGISHEKPVPFFGSFKEVALFRTSIGEYMRDVYNKTTGPYLGIFAFDQPYLVLKDPDVIKAILVKDFNSFSDRAIVSNEKDDPIGTHNLFIMKNPEWKAMRTKLSPVFSSGKIKQMFSLMNDIGNDLEKYIANSVINLPSADTKEICIKYTTDVITTCAFGINSNCLGDENAKFRQMGKKLLDFNYSRSIQMSSYFFFPGLVKLFKFKFFEPECAEFLRHVFNESLHHREQTKIKRNDLIDILIDLKGKDSSMKDDKLVAQAAIFFSAGFESSSSLMAFILYEIAKNKEIQVKLRKEILTTMAKNNGDINYDCMQDMQYLDMVCSESLRKYPPLPFLDRRCIKDYTLPGTDIILKKGVALCVPLLGLHYDPKYFPDPQKFDPERFADVNKRSRSFGAYMPFGEGPHNCIGARFGLMNSKVGLCHILSKYEVDITPETPLHIQLEPKGFLVTPIAGIPLKFKKVGIPAA